MLDSDSEHQILQRSSRKTVDYGRVLESKFPAFVPVFVPVFVLVNVPVNVPVHVPVRLFPVGEVDLPPKFEVWSSQPSNYCLHPLQFFAPASVPVCVPVSVPVCVPVSVPVCVPVIKRKTSRGIYSRQYTLGSD